MKNDVVFGIASGVDDNGCGFSIHCFRVLSTVFSLLLHLVLIPSLSPLVLLSYGSWERVLSGTVNVHMKNKTPFHTIKGAHPLIGPHVLSIASHSLENHECHVYVHVHELYAPGLTGYDYLLILCISPYVLEKNLV